MPRHGDSTCHLHKALIHFGARVDRTTLLKWVKGQKSPTSVMSLTILGMIEQRYRLPTGYFKSKLLQGRRAASGHKKLKGVGSAERRRLAWHLPDDFDHRPAKEREEILEWVRTS